MAALVALLKQELRIEARRRAARFRRRQERIDEQGCGAVIVLVRIALEDWR
jgi:hypothetical protein